MFKMGCSMARKILGPGSGSSPNEQVAAGSAAGGAGGAEKNGKPSSKSADELGDFSKLEDDPRLPLNVRQIFKITKSWKAIARTMSKTGTAMFLNLFEQNQDLFYLFDRFQHLKGRELHESMELREHAATVMATLDQSISSLSDYDNFVSYLHSIGQLHRKVPGFRREFFWKIEQPFMKAVKQTLDERCNETIEQIYVVAIKLIIETIASGYGQDDEAADADFESERGAGTGGGGGEPGAGSEPRDRSARGEKASGQPKSKSGPGLKGGAQQERTGCSENDRARQHTDCPAGTLQDSAEPSRAGCPLSSEPANEHHEISEKKSINERAAAAPPATCGHDSGEVEASLVEATCELMRSTADWLAVGQSAGAASEQPTRLHWQRLVGDLSGSRSNLHSSRQRGDAERGRQEAGQIERVASGSFMRSNTQTADRPTPDGHTSGPPGGEQTRTPTGCPPTPPTRCRWSRAEQQIIISSCPVRHCGAPNNSPRSHSAPSGCEGSPEVQGSSAPRVAGESGEGHSARPSGVGCTTAVTGDCAARPLGNIGPRASECARHSASMSSCNNNNGASLGPQQRKVPRERLRAVDLIKSTGRPRLERLASWRRQLGAALGRLLPGPKPESGRPSRSPKATSNQNQSEFERRLHCARQSRNNNKLQITPPSPSNSAEIRLAAGQRRLGEECKQGAGADLEARPTIAHDRAAKASAMLHKSEAAVFKLLAKAPQDTQLAELIKVLLLINRLLLALAARPQRPPPVSSPAEACTRSPLCAAS